MKSRQSQVRQNEFLVNEKQRQLSQIDMMLADIERMAAELEFQIVSEEKKSGITDPTHFAYPTFAKAARTRADNLLGSIQELKNQQEAAMEVLQDAEKNLEKAQALEGRELSAKTAKSA